jgi:hypothetical protein
MSKTIKYYQSENGKFKIPVPITKYQTKTSKSLDTLTDPEITLDETVQRTKNTESTNK